MADVGIANHVQRAIRDRTGRWFIEIRMMMGLLDRETSYPSPLLSQCDPYDAARVRAVLDA